MPTSPVTILHNHLVQQREERDLSFEESFEGLAHEAVWTIRIKFKGEVKGVGKGPTKARAKEEAAKEALKNMGFV